METIKGEQFLTVKDIAAAIAFDKSAAGISRTIRQVRHWTQHDLLRPYSQKNTGTGIPRLYPEEASVEVAAILLELSRYGATVDILKSVATALYDELEGHGLSFFVAVTEGESHCEVAWRDDPQTGRLTDARVNFFVNEEDMDEEIGRASCRERVCRYV